jgi:tetratricopeptide (TPR) repeat protein
MNSKMASKTARTTIIRCDDVFPSITKDPRFVAARKLVSSGKSLEGPAVEMFATLLEESRRVYGDSHIQTAACYYEYGNALFRASQKNETKNSSKSGNEDEKGNQVLDKKISSIKEASTNNIGKRSRAEEGSTQYTEKDDEDDILLALEMMETSYAILEEYTTAAINSAVKENDENGQSLLSLMEWAKSQIPRVYTGIGDVLSHLGRHADAVDIYSRAIPHREESYMKEKRLNNNISVECLKARRLVVEANVLVAEELLACNPNQDVVTTESKQVLVTKEERIDFAKGYYDKAREELQETGKSLSHILTQNFSPD